MPRADLIRRLAGHQRKALFLERKLSMLHEQPRHVLGLRADLRGRWPADLVDDRPHATRIPLIDRCIP